MSKVKVKVEHMPAFQEYVISRQTLNQKLTLLNLEALYLWDNFFWYISLEDWGKVLKDVLFGMLKYTVDKFDCDNYSLLTSAKVGERYQLNSCGIVIGSTPGGEHAWNIFLAKVDNEAKLFYCEPQDGMIFPIEEDASYKAKIIILG